MSSISTENCHNSTVVSFLHDWHTDRRWNLAFGRQIGIEICFLKTDWCIDVSSKGQWDLTLLCVNCSLNRQVVQFVNCITVCVHRYIYVRWSMDAVRRHNNFFKCLHMEGKNNWPPTSTMGCSPGLPNGLKELQPRAPKAKTTHLKTHLQTSSISKHFPGMTSGPPLEGKERKGQGRAPIRLLAQGPQHVNPALLGCGTCLQTVLSRTLTFSTVSLPLVVVALHQGTPGQMTLLNRLRMQDLQPLNGDILAKWSCGRPSTLVPQTRLSTIDHFVWLSHKHGTVFLPTSLHQLLYRLSRDN